MRNFSLIITAGGTSSRYGNTNKLLEKINGKTAAAKEFMDGENKDIDKANKLLDEADELRKEFNSELFMINKV